MREEAELLSMPTLCHSEVIKYCDVIGQSMRRSSARNISLPTCA